MATDVEIYQEESTEVAPMDAQVRGMIDIQITTARRYPRSVARFTKRAIELATLNKQIAADCTYAKPIGGNKFAIGPSIRLAEIVSQTWGNMRASARITEETDRYIVATGQCIDLETNYAAEVSVRRRITTKEGRIYSEGVIETTANAAISIALRNAIFRVVPKTVVETVRLEAASVANGSKSLEVIREEWLAYWAAKGVDEKRLVSALGATGKEDLGNEHIELLAAIATAVKDRETTLEEAFPPVQVATDQVSAAWERQKQSKSQKLAEMLKPNEPPEPA